MKWELRGKGQWRKQRKAKEFAQANSGQNNWNCCSLPTCEELRILGYSDYMSELLFAESIMGPLNPVNIAKEYRGTTFGDDIVEHHHFEDAKGKSATSVIAKNCCENGQPPVVTLYRWVGRNYL